MPSTPPPALPTVAAFQAATTPKYTFRKPARSHIGLLDEALGRWKASESMMGSWFAKKKKAGELVSLCRVWLEQRALKKEKGTFAMRKAQVEHLGQAAFAWLKYCTFESAKFDKNNLGVIGSAGASHFRGTTGLQGGYANERTAYLAGGKTTAPSLGNIHQQTPTLTQLGGPAIQTILQKNFDHLTLVDTLALDAELGRIGGAENVWFMPKSERMEHMLVVMNGRFYKGPTETFTIKGFYMYAINEYGNIFCVKTNHSGPTQNVSGGGQTAARLNHSSFNAGKDVVCAGEIQIKAGQPAIDNNSGHYKPSTQQLHNAVLMLAEDGLKLDDWLVGVKQPPGGQNSLAFFTANLFLNNPNIGANRAVAVE